MAFKDFPAQAQGVELLQRSLERQRLAHAYLFAGPHLDSLEALARTLAQTLNCQHPVRRNGAAVDCCDRCPGCRKARDGQHADVFWVRPESKLRQIKIGQIVHRDNSPPRVLLDVVNLKPTESQYKVGIIVAADRMTEEAANAFLKTLEEPPPHSVLILLTTEPERLLETIRSRCLRLNFAGEGPPAWAAAQLEWLTAFSEMAAASQKSLLGRYRLMDVLLRKLKTVRDDIEKDLNARSPLEKYEEVDAALRDQWTLELNAAVEAEYRRQRGEFLLALQWWLRDVWLLSLGESAGSQASLPSLLAFPQLAGTHPVARRLSPKAARENLCILEQLQSDLQTNVQEALALEVGLLKLHL